MIIHSFDDVLRQPRTSHSFEVPWTGKRVPLPRPVPMIAGVYLLVIELLLVVSDNVVPFTAMFGSGLSAVSGGRADIAAWLVVYVLIPVAIVYLAMSVEIDGRAPYRWVIGMARFAVSPARTWCGQRLPSSDERVRYRGRLLFWWDVHAPRLQRGFVRGGLVSTRRPARFTFSFRHLHPVLRADEGYAPIENYVVGEKIEVRP